MVMETKEHFLIKFLEEYVPSCPLCEKEGKFSEISWNLHPDDFSSQNVGDRCLGSCHNGHDIFCGVRPYIWELGTTVEETGRDLDCRGEIKE